MTDLTQEEIIEIYGGAEKERDSFDKMVEVIAGGLAGVGGVIAGWLS